MTTTQELLKSSFEINLDNYGPEDAERLNDWAINAYAALEALQAEVKHLNLHLKATQSGRDAALARLADVEKQEPVGYASKEDIAELQGANGMSVWCESSKMWGGSGDPPLPSNLTPIYAAAGASPVQPSQADAQDAARYRWLRSTTNWASNSSNERIDVRNSPELWDAAIDAAMKESK